MPEGPELHLGSLYVNKMCAGVVFTGPVRKSEVSKSPDVPFTCEAYRITASSRGKEVKLRLTPMKSDDSKQRSKAGQADQTMDVVFRFGMSGYFRFTSEDELPKHSHLCFYSKETPCRVLSFVDTRRFGSWQANGTWQPDRGPCIMFEYESFRKNVVTHLSDRAFDRPICEVLLNQKYFNGIGNYLRAEILFRLNIPPFVPARSVLEGLESEDLCENEKPLKTEIKDEKTSDRVKTVKEETGDLLRLCHTVPLEVVNQGGKELWFNGDPGPMAPKDLKSPKAKKRAKKTEDHDYTDKKKGAKGGSKSTPKKKVVKQETKTAKKEIEKSEEMVSPQKKKRPAARGRKTSSAEPAAGPEKRSGRVTRQSSK
ncbi:hypothetical protein KUCAC02_021266 [Chaenocephalus aceratus]|uniref:Uncharacterized protein n=1 Tax=Chaenocephalus aceratus TaxID=36190 RepID=A0ACB9XEZ0_CHAAC|nr:hypothetical protein KUCAC02_021266 [Chaenocephalus aceratus]